MITNVSSCTVLFNLNKDILELDKCVTLNSFFFSLAPITFQFYYSDTLLTLNGGLSQSMREPWA